MPTLQLLTQEQVLQRMIAAVVARTELTDLTDSSALKHILATIAREFDDGYFQFTRLRDLFDITRAKGDDLDARAREIAPGTLERRGARKAIGKVVFSRATNTGSTLTIPAGTVVKNSTGGLYVTRAQTSITATSVEVVSGHGVGRDSEAVAVVAVAAGAAGNVATDAITGFQSKPAGVATVTNVTSCTQGRDRESDDEFLARILTYVTSLSRCTVDAMETLVRDTVDEDTGKRVVFAHVYEDPTNRANVTLYIDDGAGTAAELADEIVDEALLVPALGGEEFMYSNEYPISLEAGITVTHTRGVTDTVLTLGTDYYVNPASGRFYVPAPSVGGIQAGDEIVVTYTPFTGLVKLVQKIVDGDPDDRATYPGCRAAGVLVRVLSPSVVGINISGAVTTLDTYDHDAVVEECVSAVLDYVNTLGISGDVVVAEIIDRIMQVDGVYDVNLTLPTSNFVVNDDQIARITAANVVLS